MIEPMTRRSTRLAAQRGTGESGFTLVELLVGASIMLVISFAALGLLEVAQRSEPEVRETNERIQEAQVGMERIVRELRQTSGVVSASPASLTVNTYLSGSSCAGGSGTGARSCRVVYSCSSGNCTRTASEVSGASPGPAVPFATDVISNEIFAYTPSATSPTGVTVTVQLRDDGGEDQITLSDGAAFRNVSMAGAS